MPCEEIKAQNYWKKKHWRATTTAISQTDRYIRKKKLKLRFKDRLDKEIARTAEKLELLRELQNEINEA